jgi:hypothetical protein
MTPLQRQSAYIVVAGDLAFAVYDGGDDHPACITFNSLREALVWAAASGLRVLCVL